MEVCYNPTVYDSNEIYCHDELPEDDKVWTCEEHVQSWINNLTEKEIITQASETSSPTKCSFDSDVFLQLPDCNGNSCDELILGAEAKHYGCNNQSLISPRLSPLISCEDKDIGKDDTEQQYVCNVPEPLRDTDLQLLLVRKSLENMSCVNDNADICGPQNKKVKLERVSSTGSQSYDSSWTGSFDNPSNLAAALQQDPEELLYSLGFCEETSILQSIPLRFFQQPSAAFGIDVDEIHNSLLLADYDETTYPIEDNSSRSFLRFSQSQSSIDLASITSSDSTNPFSAKNRHILYKSSTKDIPSIHLSQDDMERPISPTSVATSNGASWSKLATLEEVPEPSSRNSSFDSDRLSKKCLTHIAKELDINLNTLQRKLSDNSHVETLTGEDDVSHTDDDENAHLKKLGTYQRSNSDKSFSSVATVIDSSNQEKFSSNQFKPISAGESIEFDISQSSMTPNKTSSVRRVLFKMSKSHKFTDNVSQSDDSIANVNNSIDNNIKKTEKQNLTDDIDKENNANGVTMHMQNADLSHTVDTTSDVVNTIDNAKGLNDTVPVSDSAMHIKVESTKKTSRTFNESFRDFFRKRKGDPEKCCENPTIQIFITPDDNVNECFLLTLDEEGNEQLSKSDVKINSIKSTTETMKSPLNRDKNNKKSYISTALTSISNAIGLYQDSKASICSDDIVEHKKNPKLYGIFNHQTLPTHSNSAFSSLTSGIFDGGFDIYSSLNEGQSPKQPNLSSSLQQNNIKHHTHDQLADDYVITNSVSSFRPTHAVTVDSDFNRTQVTASCLSFDKTRVSPLRYSPDSPISSEDVACDCPVLKKKRKNLIELYKENSIESSGFEEDHIDIKCPLGKNCTIKHKKSEKVKRCHLCEKAKTKKGEKKRFADLDVISSTNSSVITMTHDHFDYLVQQFTALRAEMNEQHKVQECRENNLKMYVNKQLNETKKVMDNEYIGWVVKEMDVLKNKLQEKDEEIRRLRDMINSQWKDL